jgi:NAD-dependent dihydropyrimidine dehydrogenase PreA subunit
MAFVVADPCVDVLDKSCMEQCPVDCIYQGDRMAYIQPDECIDCGACEPVCPVSAIYFDEDLPEKWSDYAGAAVEFFAILGSPGGSMSVGPTSNDPERIKALPARPTSNG